MPVPAPLAAPHLAHSQASSNNRDSNRSNSSPPRWKSLEAGEDTVVLVLLQGSASADRERAGSASEDSESENDGADESASWGVNGQFCGAVKALTSVVPQVPGARTTCRETILGSSILNYQQGPVLTEYHRQSLRKQQWEREGGSITTLSWQTERNNCPATQNGLGCDP